MKKIELVSPSGNFDQFKSAVNAGADAVYLSYKKYGARAFADNFDLKDLAIVTSYASRNNVKCYLTLNTLVKDSEFDEVYDFLSKYFSFCQDGVIIQDFGIYRLIKDNFNHIPIHASTQLNIHNLASIRALKDMNFKRVVLAREMTLDEIININKEKLLEIEVFGHGSQCYSYSGNCYFSSSVGSRSGNRGRCSQPCRMQYVSGSDSKKEKFFYLSKNDICSIELIPQIVKANIDALKIEGRMKSPQYTAIVTSIYRKHIDMYYKNPSRYLIDPRDIYKLKQVFSRNMCHGYFESAFPEDMISLKKSGSVGNFLGKVIKIDYDKKNRTEILKNIYLKTKWEINKKDTLEIWTKKGNERVDIIEIYKDVSISKNLYKIKVNRESAISVNDRVFKYYDKSIDDYSKSLYGYKIKGNFFEDIKTVKLKKSVLEDYSKHDTNDKDISLLSIIYEKNDIQKIVDTIGEDILYDNFNDILNFDNSTFFKGVNDTINKIGKRFIIKIPHILYDKDIEKIPSIVEAMIDIGISDYYVSNLGAANILRDNKDIKMIMGSNLNIFNSLALRELLNFLNKSNVTDVELSEELNILELNELISRHYSKDDIKIKFLIYGFGFFPITTARVKKEYLVKDVKNKSLNYLTDEKGYNFYIGSDHNKNTVMYNSKKTCLLFDLENIIKNGISSILLDSNFINIKDFILIAMGFKKALRLLQDKETDNLNKHFNHLRSQDLFKDYTKAHIYKGTI